MANYKVSGADLTSIANEIRTKGGTSESLSFPDGFITAIENISTSGTTLITKSIAENGTYAASADNADGYSSVTVNVPQATSPLVKVGTFTVADSTWESGATGVEMCKAVLDGYLIANGFLYLLIFNGNTNTSGFRVDAIVCISTATSISDFSNTTGTICRSYYSNFVAISSTCRASVGCTVDIYRMPQPS